MNNPSSLRVMLKNGGSIAGETEEKLIVKIPKKRDLNMPAFEIKQIRFEDYPACAAVFGGNCLFAGTCLQQQKEKNREAYALYVNGEIAAECHLVYNNPEYGTVPGQRVYFSRMVTRKEYRRRGFGEKIVRFILDLAKEKGYREIALGVNCDNFAALHLYRELGFSVYETAKDDYGEYYKMERTL